MTLAQKVGQMTQAEIKSVTPEQVREYYIGSVLNGGGSWPGQDKHATPTDWVALADRLYEASMSTDMQVPVPVIWGTDAVHGHSNVIGATLFPHNIGLGAAHDRSEEQTSELQSLMRHSYAVFCLKQHNKPTQSTYNPVCR